MFNESLNCPKTKSKKKKKFESIGADQNEKLGQLGTTGLGVIVGFEIEMDSKCQK